MPHDHDRPEEDLREIGIAAAIAVTCVIIIVLLGSAALLLGCSDIDYAKYMYFGRDVRVELWSHGRMIKTWDTSTLIFKSPRHVTFIDIATNRVVGVYGKIAIKEKGK